MTTAPPEPHIWDSGEQWNYAKPCNWCKIATVYFNPNVLNPNTGKKLSLAEPYTPGTGTTPKVHWGCMKSGEQRFVKDGKEDVEKFKYVGIGSAFDKSLILESDNAVQIEAKMQLQNKLRNKWPLKPIPLELRLKYTQQYANEWKAQTFNSSK